MDMLQFHMNLHPDVSIKAVGDIARRWKPVR